MQVADRFIFANLTQALEQTLSNQTAVQGRRYSPNVLAGCSFRFVMIFCCCNALPIRCLNAPCRNKASATPQSSGEDLAFARQRLVYFRAIAKQVRLSIARCNATSVRPAFPNGKDADKGKAGVY